MSGYHLSTAIVSIVFLGSSALADVSISNKPTQNMSCSAGVCTATAKKAVLNVGDLQTMLASGDVAVKTGSLAKDINIDQSLTWSSTSRLTLDAQQSVTIKKPVTIMGIGGLTITTNGGGKLGEFIIGPKANVQFSNLSSSLIIDADNYTLVGDIKSLATAIAANPSGFYALANSYDAKNDKFDKVPIPTKFSGTFEGLGQTISYLKIRGSTSCKLGHGSHLSCTGFFAVVDAGIVRDISLQGVNVSAKRSDYIGALVGANLGTLSNVSVRGKVYGSAAYMGGMAGTSKTIIGGRAAVIVSGDGIVGGLTGGSFGTLSHSSATGAVSGRTAGGLSGVGTGITLSFATGPVSGDSAAGGLLGGGSGISQSYATGPVTGGGKSHVGGLIGGYASDITDCYAIGDVQAGQGKSFAGGLVGLGDSISTSYSAGSVSSGSDSSFTGGFVGKNNLHRSLTDNYWDTETSELDIGCGKGDCTGVVGLSTQELTSGLPDGFDPKIWGQAPNINNGYPYLLANPPQ